MFADETANVSKLLRLSWKKALAKHNSASGAERRLTRRSKVRVVHSDDCETAKDSTSQRAPRGGQHRANGKGKCYV